MNAAMEQRRDADVVFLLGAGASRDAGMPLMDDLTERCRARLPETTHPVFDAADAITRRKDGRNIESVMALLYEIAAVKTWEVDGTIAEWASPFHAGPEELLQLEAKIRAAIHAVITEASDPEKAGYLSGLLDFERPGKPLNVFTLNYDRLLEAVAVRRRVAYTTGFAETWTPGLFDRGGWRLRLFKLHGSVGWYRVEGVEVLFQGDGANHFAHPGQSASEVILYPGADKAIYADPFATILAHLTQCLESARYCVAIGYSFRDEHIRQALTDRMSTNSALHLVVVDPKAEEIASRLIMRTPLLAQRLVALPFGAKQALENRLVRKRLDDVESAESDRDRYYEALQGGQFRQAGQQLVDYIEGCRDLRLPHIANALLWTHDGEQLRKEFERAIRDGAMYCRRKLKGEGGTGAPAWLPGKSVRRRGYDDDIVILFHLWRVASVRLSEKDGWGVYEVIKDVFRGLAAGVCVMDKANVLAWPLEDPVPPAGGAARRDAQQYASRAASIQLAHDEIERCRPLDVEVLDSEEGGSVEQFLQSMLILQRVLATFGRMGLTYAETAGVKYHHPGSLDSSGTQRALRELGVQMHALVEKSWLQGPKVVRTIP